MTLFAVVSSSGLSQVHECIFWCRASRLNLIYEAGLASEKTSSSCDRVSKLTSVRLNRLHQPPRQRGGLHGRLPAPVLARRYPRRRGKRQPNWRRRQHQRWRGLPGGEQQQWWKHCEGLRWHRHVARRWQYFGQRYWECHQQQVIVFLNHKGSFRIDRHGATLPRYFEEGKFCARESSRLQ